MKTYSDYGSSHGPSATRDSHASSSMSHMSSDGDRFGPPVKAPSSGPGNSGRPVPRNPSGDYNAKVYAERNKAAAAATQSPEEEESSRREGAGFIRSNEGILAQQDPSSVESGGSMSGPHGLSADVLSPGAAGLNSAQNSAVNSAATDYAVAQRKKSNGSSMAPGMRP